jgi:hypothetical protein
MLCVLCGLLLADEKNTKTAELTEKTAIFPSGFSASSLHPLRLNSLVIKKIQKPQS